MFEISINNKKEIYMTYSLCNLKNILWETKRRTLHDTVLQCNFTKSLINTFLK